MEEAEHRHLRDELLDAAAEPVKDMVSLKAAHKVQFFWIRTLESNRTLRSNGIGLFRGLGLLGPNQVGLSGGLGLLD